MFVTLKKTIYRIFCSKTI